ncbi:MAG: hypothetical protein K9L31_02800, partial [Candidatus Pacebacteria bacterium]|nr:hypothetical protein [Candidatus Paceibacterota bacterium]
MSVLLLSISGIVTATLGVSILILQRYRISKGKITFDENYDGPAQVSTVLHVVIRYTLKRSVYFRKFFMQYMFHVMVRIMSYVDTFTTILYAKSRNWFVENAVRNRGTVPHFWHH